MKKINNQKDYCDIQTETYGVGDIKRQEKQLLGYSSLCFNYFLEEMKDGMSKIVFCFPDVLIEKTKIKEEIYDFNLEKNKIKTTLTKKYYFPAKTKKQFLDRLRLAGKNYIVKGNYSFNDIEKRTISSYGDIVDDEKHAHYMEITIYTKEKFTECFINEIKSLIQTYNYTLNQYIEGSLNLSVSIDELFENELSRLFDYYEEVENKEELIKSLGIDLERPKEYIKKI